MNVSPQLEKSARVFCIFIEAWSKWPHSHPWWDNLWLVSCVSHSTFLIYRYLNLYKNRVLSVIFRSLYILKFHTHMRFYGQVISVNVPTKYKVVQLQNTSHAQRLRILSANLLSLSLPCLHEMSLVSCPCIRRI